ncbi:MAG TPA: hypothetical protein VHO70_08125 [Chitinispirillaceae bacterium]|nr:hypothetical protein [Chitinispirillaceae bacterium]
MDESTKVLSLLFLPALTILFSFGIYIHVNNVSINNSIEKREKSFVSIPVTVTRYVICEVTQHYSSSGGSAAYDKAFYHVYIGVEYKTGNELIQSFGKFREFKTVEDALSHYESLPNRPALFYQQNSSETNSVREEVIAKLSAYKSEMPTNTHQLSIMCDADNPAINQLTTKDKKTLGGVYGIYGVGVLILFFYFLFGHLAKIGNAVYPPFYWFAGSLALFLVFMVYYTSTKKISVDREPLPAPQYEIEINKNSWGS